MPRKSSAAAEFIGERIRDARLQYSMTHDTLAAKTGIDSSNIRSYESGRSMPSIQTLIRLADALAIEPGDLIRGLTADLFEMPRQRDTAS